MSSAVVRRCRSSDRQDVSNETPSSGAAFCVLPGHRLGVTKQQPKYDEQGTTANSRCTSFESVVA
jgi:hypothetical protein